MKPLLGILGVVALLLIASGSTVSKTPAPSPASAGDSAVELVTLLEASTTAECNTPAGDTSATADPDLLAVAAPHCCATGAAAACRDQCKQQGPGCKGSIGCRAGECVCTCSCR